MMIMAEMVAFDNLKELAEMAEGANRTLRAFV